MKKFASLLLSFVMMVTFMPTMTFTAFAASQSINVTSSTSGTTTNLTTNIGETITVNLKNGGSSTLTFSGNVSPSGAATVSSSKSIAGGSTGTFTVTANKAGTITVILRSGTSSSSQKATLKITAVDPLEGFSIKAVKDSEHGLDGDVNIELSNSGAQYSGTLYLPGNADKDNVHLAWADTSVKLKTGNTTYESGKCPLASTYTVIKDDYEASLNLTIKQGSSTVKGLFLQVNEDLGTIAKMNDDTYHETSCYGGASFGGSDYFMSIKGRGNYTWKQQAKKPYNITFYKEEFTKDNIDTNSKAKVSMVDGVKTKKWSMLANYADPSLMRNKIGYDLANELGVGLGTEYYDIWMNGEYLGNYLITPKTDYEIEDSGFQLELDNKEEKGPSPDPQFWLDGIKKHGSDSYNCFTLKDIGDDALVELSGKSLEENPTPSDCVPAIQAWMQSALDAIKTTNSEEYQNYIDVESWAKVYLLNELYKNYDIVSGSIFMYRDGLTADDKLKAGPIWDLDNALGRTGICGYSGIDSTTQKSGDKWYIDSINGEDSMLQFLGMHESFMECVYRMYNDYKDSFEGAKTNLSNTKARISDSAAMDFAKYGNSRSYNNASVSSQTTVGTSPYNVVYGKTSTYENYCTNLNDFLSKRLLFLNDKLSIDAPSASVQGETENLIIYSDLDLSVPAPKTGKYTSYQWQKYDVDKAKWKNIKGETTSNYKATVDESFDGLQVRCKMLYDSGTKFSETSRVKAAELTKDVITDGVSISITMEGHEHRYLKNVIDEKYFKCDAGCDYGTTYYKSCICGESSEGKGELEATFQEDDAKGHVFEKTEAVLANFTDSGNLEYYTCQREDCGRYFLDEEGKNEIEENQWIVPAIDKDSVSIDDSKCVYDGNAQKPVFEIKDVEGTSLVEDKDYTLSYSDNVDAGQATLKVQFIGNYEGELEESFTVSPKHIDISEADIKIASTSEFNYDYTGLPLEPEAVLVGYPEDWYEVVYENNINAGDDALVKARFVGNYEGEATKAFTINRIPLPKIRSIRPAVIAYDGTPKEPHVIIDAPADGKPLVRGVDFVATYSNNVEIGVGTVVVEGIGNFYGGYYEKKFDIGIRTLPGTLTLESPADFDYHYDGTAKEPKVIVTDSEEGRQLVEGEDYTVTYSGEHTEPGEVIVTVEGIRGYKGTRTLKFQIKKAQLPKIEDLECVEYTYDGTAKTPGFELVGPAGKLQEGVDYSVEYKANTNAGIAKVIATAIDGSPYVGSSERTFSIYHKEFEADIEMPSDFDYGYTGHEIKPEPIVNSKDKNATYDFVYKKNVEIGTAFVTVAASGNYKGSYIK
ncbi:MAG: CotH kinase family protein, partial [Clostridia bacterium]|nr:CotH kinase family protein [Clostridia bacterium]